MRLFNFDEADSQLTLIPTAGRRALDTLGLRLSLEGWRSLAHSDRQALVNAGSHDAVDTQSVARAVQSALPAPQHILPETDPAADAVPDELQLALGAERALSPAVWQGLTALERYALHKAARSARPERLTRAYAEIVGHSAYSSHLAAQGGARMVRISSKDVTLRRASAESQVLLTPEVAQRLAHADVPKGDVLGTARLAGIMAAKRTSEWIPLCHPLRLTHVNVQLTLDTVESRVRITADVEAEDKTGVEMEALVAVSAAALTVYDMLKGLDRGMVIGPTQLMQKSGGRSGDFVRG